MIRQKNKYAEKVIDLDGQEGNAFVLLGYARSFAKDLKLDFKKIRDEMTSGDYKHLLKVFQKYKLMKKILYMDIMVI